MRRIEESAPSRTTGEGAPHAVVRGGAAGRAGAVALLALAAARVDAVPPRYRALVEPPLREFASAYPGAFDGRGAIVGHASPEPFHPESVAVRAAGGTIVELPAEARVFNQALGAAGEMVVGMIGFQAARWIDGAGLPLLPLPGYHSGVAWDANESGLIVGIQINDLFGLDLPVWWASHEVEPALLPLPGPPFSGGGAAFAVNAAGTVVGVAAPDGAYQAVRWDSVAAQPIVIGPLRGAHGGEARAINDAGDIAGRSSFPDLSVRPMLHLGEEDELIDLGSLGGTYGEALGINGARQVVGASGTGTQSHAFLWEEGTLHDLNDLVVASNAPFDHLTVAVDIDEQGRIAAEAALGPDPFAARRIVLLVPCAAADLDCDGQVGGADLGLLLGQWGGAGSADLDGSGAVDGADLGLLLGDWS